ncbi:MAG: response regulator [Lachnospiraceae bacterium]|nr:response regulator [Lachnospiraceae bacterium]
MAYQSVPEVLFHLSLSISAFAFNVVLFLMVIIQGIDKSRERRRFTDLLVVVLLGNFITCVSFFVKETEWGFLFPRLAITLRLLTFVMNMSLTYYFLRYLQGYMDDREVRPGIMRRMNKVVLFSGYIGVAIVLLLQFVNPEPTGVNDLPGWVRVVFGFIIELYYLAYSTVFVLRQKNRIDERSYRTAAYAFGVTIGGVLLEAFNPTGILVNYFGAVVGLFIFYTGVETPDYKKLLETLDSLEEARQRAEEASNSKSEFLASMSHEIRTPINAVIGMNEMILRESNDPNILSYAGNIESAGRNLLSIISDILDFSKIEAGRMEILEAPYQFSSLINDVANMVSFRAESKGLKFHIDMEETLPDELYGDEVRVRQVMINILNNAVKYTEKGEVSLCVRGTREDDIEFLRIEVTDTGIGIRQEDLDKLFSKFTRVDLGKNRTVEGTGLGLAITRSLMEMMGGTVEAESVYGKGSTFRLMLPQRVMGEETVGNYREKFRQSVQENRNYRESFHAPDARILVVDDTLVNLTVVKGLLKKTEVKIETAMGGAQALEMTQETPYDLIFLDQRMPGMDGEETLTALRSQMRGKNAKTPVICLTADAISGARERYLSKGFTDYLTKPVEGYVIEAMMSKYLPADKLIWVTEGNVAKQERSPEEPESLKEAFDRMGLSYEDALKNLATEELLLEVMKEFATGYEENIDTIETYLAQRNYVDYTTKVHALKSSARIVGANGLSDSAAGLEKLGNQAADGDEQAVETILMQTPDVLARYLSVAELFRVLTGGAPEEAEEAKEEIPPEELAELYEAVEELAMAGDLDSIEGLLAQTEKYAIPEAQQERYEGLKLAVHASDWERISLFAKG